MEADEGDGESSDKNTYNFGCKQAVFRCKKWLSKNKTCKKQMQFGETVQQNAWEIT